MSLLKTILNICVYVCLFVGFTIILESGISVARYNSDKAQDVHTSGVIASKWVERREVTKRSSLYGGSTYKTTKIDYKIGIIYSLDPNQSIENKAFEKVKKRHQKRIREVRLQSESGNTDINLKKIRQTSEAFAISNRIKAEDVFFTPKLTNKKQYTEYNLGDEIRLEYLSNRPWVMVYNLKKMRKTSFSSLRFGFILFLFSSIICFIRLKK